MRAYVDSGVDWLGDIPSEWTTQPLWSMFQRIKDVGHPQEQMLSVFRDHGVVAKDSRANNNQTAENRDIYQLVHPGWLVANRMKAWQGSVGISDLRGIVSGHYICFAPNHDAHGPFLNWLFRSPPYAVAYALQSRGVRIGQAEIDNDLYRAMPVLLPPLVEQRAIAGFLDRETERVDTLIGEQESLIARLDERKKAVIDTVTSRGLDPHVECVDSGIGWLGAVPRHWSIRPLWTMFNRTKDVGHPDEEMLSVFRDLGVVAKNSHKNTNWTADNRNIYQLVHPGWLVTNRMKAWQGSVGISSRRGIVSGHYICFDPTHREDHRYLNFLFRSARYVAAYGLISRGVRIGQAEIDNDDYRLLQVLVPPISEQRRIVEYLGVEIAKIDRLIEESERIIKLSRERRSVLITAAVTGQIDVRDEVE
ncbi:hypothetical protein OG579_11850 [Williamsia herbipolensis]|uniref:Restriction endonuclease subunit S n=1 Tax=Williamsia herbipolensis TaxID=1603258 RepID=A0AAU4JXI3_9NOCA|nr:hypothetical protein [Williamsia herbipolensis]